MNDQADSLKINLKKCISIYKEMPSNCKRLEKPIERIPAGRNQHP